VAGYSRLMEADEETSPKSRTAFDLDQRFFWSGFFCSRGGLIWLNARRDDARLICAVSEPEEL